MKDYIDNPIETRFRGISLNEEETYLIWSFLNYAIWIDRWTEKRGETSRYTEKERKIVEEINKQIKLMQCIWIDESPF